MIGRGAGPPVGDAGAGEGGAGGGPTEATPERGWVAPEVGDELAGLALRYAIVERGPGRSPRAVKERLRALADRWSGAQAINLRHRDIPWAYRVFYRHIGLDPDEQPTPIERLVLERIQRGGFPNHGLPADALAIATVESGVALRAFDADRIDGRPGIRPSQPGESLEGRPGALPPGTLVIADERRPASLLFGAAAADRDVDRHTTRTLVCAIQVKGVPDIAVTEALWLATDALRS